MRNKKKLKKRGFLKAAIYANCNSQAEFGELVGWTEQQVSQAITGRRKLSRAEMARISQVLNTPARLLFGDEVDVG